MQPEVVKIRQHGERAVPDEAPAILKAGIVAHVGFIQDGIPQVIPMNYQYDPAEPASLYLHGAHDSRALLTLAQGAQACVTITLVDGLVLSKTAKFHSINYRCVVCYGRARRVEDAAVKARIFEGMIERMVPGRKAGQDYEPTPKPDLDATAVVEFRIESWSAKSRQGGPKGPHDDDGAVAGSSGVIPLGRG